MRAVYSSTYASEPRNLRRSARPHMILLIIFPSFSFSSSRSLSCVFIAIASPQQQFPFKLDDLRVPIPILSAFTAPFLLFFPSFPPRASLSRTTQHCYHAALVRPHFSSLFSLPLCLQLLYSITITGNPEVAATIQNLDTARMYIRPPSCSSRRASIDHHSP